MAASILLSPSESPLLYKLHMQIKLFFEKEKTLIWNNLVEGLEINF